MTGGSGVPGPGSDDHGNTATDPSDRRTARSARTRARLMQAMIGLIEVQVSDPTARQVAQHAGVAVRTIYHLFDDVDDLFCQATALQAHRHRASVALIPPSGPVGPRIRATARQRRQHFEEVGPVLRVAYARTRSSPGLHSVLAEHRRILREQLTVTFGPEIAARGREAQVVLEVVDLATGWQNWNALRFDLGHTATAAEQIMVFAVSTVLR
jgi:TetR/AcrR family transcriptional regulator, regulator of autoinduction and epiphytic fitness